MATANIAAAFLAANLGSRVTLTILEDDNPDGRSANTRENANRVDLNRNFPAGNFDASNPTYGGHALSQPEARTLADLIATTKPDLIIVCHAFKGGQFINFDGPAAELAARFSALSGMPIRSDVGYPTPGSLGTYVGVDLHVPIFTVEWLFGSDPARDWDQSKAAFLSVIGSG